ncbi:dynamin family protein [Bradyrhizobium oligotrophicum]|uniref:dynamin family protein n=1 Tax=Bradyrhizobium oligotrophicum TaxID=44255 RepID=UPI003EB846FF
MIGNIYSKRGHDLEAILTATLQRATRLRPLLDERNADMVDALMAEAKANACRIAVVGQVKAGKSSLINALIRRPRFLPTDVNPWTSVVTKLHFGTAHEFGAVFQFFDEGDWDRLASGGRLLELSRRLGVTLDADTLGRQVRAMRESAELRLGKEFRKLLGRQHCFETASAEVLARYVCVGETFEGQELARSRGFVGRFADITKSADLYFDQAPFALPTVVIDTPGTNDPFLVRDQLSRESLDHTDACIVVLNAQQALSSSDLDLLRLLRGLQKEKLVVFVNRVDLLGRPIEEGQIVMRHVRDKLADEFPGHEIPIIIGSALQAERAIAAELGLADPMEQGTPGVARSAAGDLTDEARSLGPTGLEELSEVLSGLIVRGPAQRRLTRIQLELIELIAGVDLAARDEMALLDQRIAAAREDVATTIARQENAARALKQLEALAVSIGTDIREGFDAIQGMKDAGIARLDESLRDVVAEEAAAAREKLLQTSAKREQVVQFDTADLRLRLEGQFKSLYDELARQVQEAEIEMHARLLDRINPVLPDEALLARYSRVEPIDPSPSIAALGSTIALELDDQWRSWWRLWTNQKQRSRRLEELIVQEFQPLLDSLVASAAGALDDHLARVMAGLTNFSEELGGVLRRHKTHAVAQRGLGVAPSAAQIQTLQKRRAVLEDRVNFCVEAATDLDYMSRRVNS